MCVFDDRCAHSLYMSRHGRVLSPGKVAYIGVWIFYMNHELDRACPTTLLDTVCMCKVAVIVVCLYVAQRYLHQVGSLFKPVSLLQ